MIIFLTIPEAFARTTIMSCISSQERTYTQPVLFSKQEPDSQKKREFSYTRVTPNRGTPKAGPKPAELLSKRPSTVHLADWIAQRRFALNRQTRINAICLIMRSCTVTHLGDSYELSTEEAALEVTRVEEVLVTIGTRTPDRIR